MRLRRSVSLFAGVLLLVLSAIPRVTGATASKEKPHVPGVQRERVSLVLINVVVTDRKGNSLNDLRPEEFTLRVDGHLVPIESVDVQLDHHSFPPGEDAARASRRFVFFFDALTSARGLRPEAVRSARRFLARNLPPGNEVMVAGLGRKLKIYQEFTADPAKFLAALDAVEADPVLFARGKDLTADDG